MARKNVKVIIPRNPDRLIELGEQILAKHDADPASSPLAGLNIAEFAAKVALAKERHAMAKKLRKDAETATEDRDHALGHKKDQSTTTEGTVLNYVTRSRHILMGVYKGKEQHLGNFGFEVNQSTNSARTKRKAS